jgi:hypothetical protein
MNTQPIESVLNTHRQYDSGFLEKKPIINTKISPYASQQMRATDPFRAKYLSKHMILNLVGEVQKK